MRAHFKTLLRWPRGAYGYGRKNFVLDELIFAVTYQCNFRCRTCFYAHTMDKSTVHDAQELSLDEIKQVSYSLGTLKNLLISGGEPFLRDDLPEICEIFYRHNKICHIHLPTNGFNTDRIVKMTHAILQKCQHSNITIGLSLDGLRTTHDAIKGVEGSFDRVIETTKGLAELKKNRHNLELYIITVVTQSTVDEIVTLSEFVKNSLPVDGHGPSPVRGVPYDTRVVPPGYKEWNDLASTLISYHRYWNQKTKSKKLKSFLATNRTRYLYKVYTRVLQGRGLPFRCQAGNSIGVLEPNGDIKLCELTDVIGNVRSANYDFKKIWLSEKADNERKKARRCSCTHACFLSPSIALSLPATIKSSFCFTMAKPS
jgi:MoaA/NifB/PqqE/SkfB family radical SAM enzyme